MQPCCLEALRMQCALLLGWSCNVAVLHGWHQPGLLIYAAHICEEAISLRGSECGAEAAAGRSQQACRENALSAFRMASGIAHGAFLSLQCGLLSAALRQQQQARASLEGQLTGSRQRVKELQVWRWNCP